MWDYDNDGDLDIIVSHVDLRGTATLLRNDGGNRQHWVGLTLRGTRPATAVAAQVTVQAGDLRQVAVNQPGNGYLSFHDPRMHFGLGSHTRIDQLEVRWSDGGVDVCRDLPADRYVTIVQGQSR